MRRALFVSALVACGAPPDDAPRAPVVIAPPPIRPQPGIDLAGPIPQPVRGGGPAHRTTPAQPLDLIADRALVRVDVPQPPPGGAIGFSFDDERAAWVVRIPDLGQLPAVAYGDGKIYVSGGFESVTYYALDAETGRAAWVTSPLEDNGPTAAVYDEGRIVFNTESCTLFALDAKSGRRLWHRWLGDPTLAQTAVGGGLVYASHPAQDGGRQELSAYRVQDGTPMWTSDIGSELLAAPVIAGDSVYVSTTSGSTFRFERASGRRVWRRTLGATTAPWIVGDELYVTRRRGDAEQQIVVDAATGTITRDREAARGTDASNVPRDLHSWKAVWAFEGSRPVIDRGVRYVAMGGELDASDASTGEPLWRRRYKIKTDQRSMGSVALAGSAIVVSTRDGKLFALDIDTGYTLWSYDVGHSVVAEPIVAKGWVYLATSDGYVIALHVADPTLDGWHMFGGNPQHDGLVAHSLEG